MTRKYTVSKKIKPYRKWNCRLCRLPIVGDARRRPFYHGQCRDVIQYSNLQVFKTSQTIYSIRREGIADYHGSKMIVTPDTPTSDILTFIHYKIDPWIVYEEVGGGLKWIGVDIEKWKRATKSPSPVGTAKCVYRRRWKKSNRETDFNDFT